MVLNRIVLSWGMDLTDKSEMLILSKSRLDPHLRGFIMAFNSGSPPATNLFWVLSAFFWVFLGASGCSGSFQRSAEISSKSPPHIILIVADDLGYSDLGFTGVSDISTPQLDRIAMEGIVCTDAHVVASVCAPSRAGLLTGRYPQTQGFECNLGGAGTGLLAGTTTLASRLKSVGYQTALVGKWHLGAQSDNHPRSLGFDHFSGILGGSRSYFPVLEKPLSKSRLLERDGERVPESSFSYFTDWITDEGVRLIQENTTDKPLFLMLSYTAPHTPMHARPDLLEKYTSIKNQKRRKYAAMVAALDEGVGKIRSALSRKKIEKDTLIVFLSDNGGATNNASDNGTWRGMKGSKWEGGHRVPFVFHWPGRFDSGENSSLISSLDLTPTFLAAAGSPTHTPSPELDGLNLLPLLEDSTHVISRETLYWRRTVAAAVRQGDWKLIRIEEENSDYKKPILVQLSLDPGETTNRATEEPERVKHLLGLLKDWELELTPPRWETGDIWRRYQRQKHEIDLLGREEERKLP